jgi:hypothetical protein
MALTALVARNGLGFFFGTVQEFNRKGREGRNGLKNVSVSSGLTLSNGSPERLWTETTKPVVPLRSLRPLRLLFNQWTSAIFLTRKKPGSPTR